MASFVLYLVNSKRLKFSTITGYIWAVVDAHLSAGLASPVAMVRDWSNFVGAVEVEMGNDIEPRKMLPLVSFLIMSLH